MNRIIDIWIEEIKCGEAGGTTGIRACGDIVVPIGDKDSAVAVMRVYSPGLWDIEKPSDEYMGKVIHEELERLWYLLRAVGCAIDDESQWKKAKTIIVKKLWEVQIPSWSRFIRMDPKEVDPARKERLKASGAE